MNSEIDREYHLSKCKDVTFDEKALVFCGDEETKYFKAGDYCLYDDIIIKICSIESVDKKICSGSTRFIFGVTSSGTIVEKIDPFCCIYPCLRKKYALEFQKLKQICQKIIINC